MVCLFSSGEPEGDNGLPVVERLVDSKSGED
jgi:hypothetical protein